ncbi:MAG TPA: alpha/beta hydrolase family protein [Limnochordia bacterium]
MNADTYVHDLVADTHRRFAFRAQSEPEARNWQRAFRPALVRALGLDRIAQRGAPPLRARQVAVEAQPDHVREEWRLETEPGFELPFYLLRPLHAAGRLPLVLTPHGHGKQGKRTYVGLWETDKDRQEIEAGERDIALQAVREGYLAIAPDMRGFAALRRRQEIERDANNSCRTLQMHALLFGRTLVGERVWDMQRLLDWALAREDVDAERVAITGNSGGGTVSLFTAAVDERVRVSVPGSYFCTFQHSIGSVYHCECNYIPGILALGEMYDVAGLIAPRPFLAVTGEEDPIFPIAAVKESFARLQAIYAVFGAADACQLSVNPGGHRYYKRDVWPFVRKAFGAVGAARRA